MNMEQSKEKGKAGKRGFGSLDEDKKREMASKGGRASAKGNTANRGFASMDKNKQRKISSEGGRASQNSLSGKDQGSSGRSREDEDLKNISSQVDTSERDLSALEEEEITGTSQRGDQSAAYSDTDEDEDEGLGDGNLGRSTREGP
jgi:uncharacterized protein